MTNVDLLTSFKTAVRTDKYLPVVCRLDNCDLFALLMRPETRLTCKDGRWTQGVAVFNSETTTSAVYVPQAVFDSETRSYALLPDDATNKVIHRKKKGFAQHLDGVVQGAIQHDSIINRVIFSAEWRAVKTTGSVAKTVEKLKRKLASEGVGGVALERLSVRLAEVAGRSNGTLSRRQIYSSLLGVADELSQSRQLRVFAAQNFLWST